jgi:hypothetical protein
MNKGVCELRHMNNLRENKKNSVDETTYTFVVVVMISGGFYIYQGLC